MIIPTTAPAPTTTTTVTADRVPIGTTKFATVAAISTTQMRAATCRLKILTAASKLWTVIATVPTKVPARQHQRIATTSIQLTMTVLMEVCPRPQLFLTGRIGKNSLPILMTMVRLGAQKMTTVTMKIYRATEH